MGGLYAEFDKDHHLILERGTLKIEQGQGDVNDVKWSTIVLIVIPTKPLWFFSRITMKTIVSTKTKKQ